MVSNPPFPRAMAACVLLLGCLGLLISPPPAWSEESSLPADTIAEEASPEPETASRADLIRDLAAPDRTAGQKAGILRRLDSFRGKFTVTEVGQLISATRGERDLFYHAIYATLPFQAIAEDDLRAIAQQLDQDNHQPGLQYYAICFTRLRRSTAQDHVYYMTARAVIAKPLIRLAKRIGDKPISLRAFVGQAFMEWDLPGAPQVLISAVSDGLKWHETKPGVGSAYGAIEMLAKLTGRPTGVTSKPPQPRDVSIAGHEWLAWWNTVNNRPGYSLPWDDQDFVLQDRYF